MASNVLFGLFPAQLYSWAASLFLLLVLYKATQLYLRRRFLLTAFSSFPGPKRHWLYGNALQFLQVGKELDLILKWAQVYPYGVSMWLGNFHAALFLTHPDYAKAILARQDPKDETAYKYIVPWIGEGLLVLSGPKWFQHRRLLTPGFHYDVLKPYVTLMSDCTRVMLDKWDKLTPNEKTVELFHHVSLMTLDTIMKCAFSYNSSCQNNRDNSYIKAVYELSYLLDQRSRFFLYHNDAIFYLSPLGFRFRRALTVAHQHTDKVIKHRKQSLMNETELDKIKQKRHLDFLDILLCAKDENGKGLSDKDLRAEVDTFMFEGHDTTASGISWILYCMAKYPEHQQKCREEIRELLGDRETMEWGDLGQMPYTTLCIKESIRLYPPVPTIGRRLCKPITFCDGRSLPEGTEVLTSIYAINRSPSVWNDPEVFQNNKVACRDSLERIGKTNFIISEMVFDPLRFSPENSDNRHSHAFVPFSAGARNCIGQNFAMNEMKVAVALTLQRYELFPDPDKEPQIIPQVVLRSLNGIHIKIRRVEKEKNKEGM